MESVKKVMRRVKVKNALGLHARPAAVIAKLLQGTKCDVTLSYRTETVDARSVMNILMLGAKKMCKSHCTLQERMRMRSRKKL